MRLTKIKFCGYKRLLDTSCNVDANLIALLGPNEAGKTSVLEGLNWLTSGGALPKSTINRTMDQGQSLPVVSATYVLEEHDQTALAPINSEVTPRTVEFSRFQNGHSIVQFTPSLTRPTKLKTLALDALTASDVTPPNDEITSTFDAVVEIARKDEYELSKQDNDEINTLVEWLEMPPTIPQERSSDESSDASTDPIASKADLDAAQALQAWQQQMSKPAPQQEAEDIIKDRIPDFLLFTQEDRDLRFEYDLEFTSNKRGGLVPSDDVSNPPRGLKNLLRVGGTTIRDLADLVPAGDEARTLNKLRKVSKQLTEEIAAYWQQRDVEIEVRINATRLQIFIHEDVDTARFTDRSDGLRSFIALIAFLKQHQTTIPPVLLIDEADMHLHYNAQADLINRLQSIAPIRTIYTTHSPGCLPLDLGTGIRVIRPHPTNPFSTLSNTFWEDSSAGLNPLLFSMGASAAAFSAVRNAVFAEGPSDMILLPTMIRTAVEKTSLNYQVVPGISGLPINQLNELAYEATRIAYLLDGDTGGSDLAKHLEDTGTPSNLIFHLPENKSLEDLVEPQEYIKTINSILKESGKHTCIRLEQLQPYLDEGQTISKAVEKVLGEDNSPGKTIVASRLINRSSEEPFPLTSAAYKYLQQLHESLESVFQNRDCNS